MTLRLVGKDPPKKQTGGPRHESIVLSPDEQRKARQALRNLKDHFGTWACLADAMGMRTKSRVKAVSGRYGLSPAVLLRTMRASGLGLGASSGRTLPRMRRDLEIRMSRALISHDRTRAR
jgi:hypothetical protein